MSLRVKVLILVIVLNIATVISLNVFGHEVFISNLRKYKEQNLDKRTKIVRKIIEDQINGIDNSVRDYAYWDDTYAFMQSFDPVYVESNLGKQTFANIEVDYIAFFDVLGNMYFSTGHKHSSGEKFDISEELSGKLEQLSFALYSENTNALGVITSGDSIYYVVSRPILRSDKTGPAIGTLMMIREFDDEARQNLADLVQDPYEILIYKDIEYQLNVPLLATLLDRNYIIDSSQKQLTSYSLINGIDHEPTIVVRMNEDAALTKLEDNFFQYLNIFLILIALLNIVITLLFMNNLVINPLRYLVREVDRIRTRKVASQRLTIKSQGEMQQLAANINSILDTLDTFDKKLVSVNKAMEEKTKELESNTSELERLNRHMVGRELRMAELKEQIEDLQFKLNEKTDDIQQ